MYCASNSTGPTDYCTSPGSIAPRAAGKGRNGDGAIIIRSGWAEGVPPTDPAIRPDMARRIHAITQPALRAAAWPRWLLLERAFLDGSTAGDLLFVALTLRTMCEEVQRLHAIDLDADRLAYLAASDVTEDRERLELYWSVA
jgi:hypothetical protein